MNEQTFQGVGGVEIFTRSWRPEGSALGVVVLVHGLKSHSGLYEQDRDGSSRGEGFVSVHALDLRGHGNPGGRAPLHREVRQTASTTSVSSSRARRPRTPTSRCSSSVATAQAQASSRASQRIDHGNDIAGLVSESFAHELPAPDFALAVLKGISHVAPHAHVLALKDEDFSRDPTFVARMKSDPLIPHVAYPSQTVAELVRADERLKKEFSRITLPVLILHGTADKAAKPSGSQHFHDAVGSADKTLKLYEGYFHDLLNDVGRETVLADITEWLTTRARKAGSA